MKGDLERTDLDRGIGLYHKGEHAIGTALQGRRGYRQGLLVHFHQHPCRDEFTGPEQLMRVREGGFDADRAAGLVDLVVKQRHRAGVEHGAVIARQGHDAGGATRQRLGHLRHRILRQREHHRNRLNLRHHHDATGVAGMHDVARIHLANAGAAVDGRGDGRVAQLRARVLDGRVIGFELRLGLRDGGALRVHGLLARQILWCEQQVAIHVALRIAQLRLILRALRQRLIERGLERARVDLRQQLALLQRLPFRKRHRIQLPIHPCSDLDRVVRLHRAQAIEVPRDITADRTGGIDGDRRRRGMGIGSLRPAPRV
jgi:hypothetical protein